MGLAGGLLFLLACQPTSSTEIDPRIATCSGAAGTRLSTEAQIDMSAILKGEGGLTAEAESRMITILNSDAGARMSGAELLAYQQNYLGCIAAEGARADAAQAAPWENPSPAQCRAARICEASIMAQVNTCLEVVEDEAGRRGLDPAPLQADCFATTRNIPACFRADSQSLPLARTLCAEISQA